MFSYVAKEIRNMETILKIKNGFLDIIQVINNKNKIKIVKHLAEIPLICALDNLSNENKIAKALDENKKHPIGVSRGEIYNFKITENVGSELSGNHLCVIIQNKKGNIYAEKVNVLHIEGDGTRINPNYQIQLTNDDLSSGYLIKNPSRIILTDIMTYDKARIGRKIGQIKPEKMLAINNAIKKQLQL